MSELRLVRGVLRFGRYAIISSRLGQFFFFSIDSKNCYIYIGTHAHCLIQIIN